MASVLAAGASAEQASQPSSVEAGQLDVSSGGGDGSGHSCALLADANLRCWGFGGAGRLGYANTNTIGDDETPGSAGPVDLGAGLTAKAISAGASHTCVILSADSSVRCWGFGGDGRLGYSNRDSIGDNEPPGSAGSVDLGMGRSAKAVSAGQSHTCALLDNDTVLCWGFAGNGQLGYGDPGNPDADEDAIGDNETPASAGAVNIGGAAAAITAGAGHTCALLNGGSVRCWGYGGNGRLGYANTATIGDDEAPASAGPVALGPGMATAVSAGNNHSCALLEGGRAFCWGYGADGRLGYAGTSDIGDDETPASAGAIDLDPARATVAISAGAHHSCARLDDASLRCWGSGANGRLGYCDELNIGDDEVPASAGQVPLTLAFRAPNSEYPRCSRSAGATPPASDAPAGAEVSPLEAEAARRRGYRSCLRKAARHARGEITRARRSPVRRRARLERHIKGHRTRLRRACVKRYGRTPGRVTGLKARAVSRRKVVLTFHAPGTDGTRPPAARGYLVKQSSRPIRGARDFRRAQTLCKGSCRFPSLREVGTEVRLTVDDLRPHTTYYYAVAARDNVSGRLGPRTGAVKTRTR